MSRIMRNMATGAMIGMAVSAMILPQLDRRTQKNMRRASKRAMNMAGDAYDSFMHYVR